MNVTEHRSNGANPPAQPAKPNRPGPRPPPKHVSADARTALVSQATTGQATTGGPETAPSHFDRYLRKALERNEPAARFALNPQPLPPKTALLASIVLLFSEQMNDLAEAADLMPRYDGECGANLMSSHVAAFVDEVSARGLHVRWPFPWRAPEWFTDSLTGPDLIVMGTQFEQAVALAIDRDIGRIFSDAAHALLEAGAARLA
jgi:hypothetical protein